MHRRELIAGAASAALLSACASATRATDGLDAWIARQRTLSIAHLSANIAPSETWVRDVETRWLAPERMDYVRAQAAAGALELTETRVRQAITARPGSLTAAARGGPGEPDYFFHWLRDSGIAMHALAGLCESEPAEAGRFAAVLADFTRFSRDLQQGPSPNGLADTRFNMDGTLDILQWNRPQMDGPALRALALIRADALGAPALLAAPLKETIRADLGFVATHWREPGYDLWEENLGFDFHARVAQVGALHAGERWARAEGDAALAEACAAAEAGLRQALDTYWLPARGHYGFYGGGGAPGPQQARANEAFDAAIVTAAVHARLPDGRFSLADDRIMSSAAFAEDEFTRLYPINQRRGASDGVLYGRYDGDIYFGGNPWAFISLEFAEAFYRMAAMFVAPPAETAASRDFLRRARARANGDLRRGLALKGDDILRVVRRLTPPSGELPEQYDKNTGAPVSSASLSWSHAAFIAASDARAAAYAAIG